MAVAVRSFYILLNTYKSVERYIVFMMALKSSVKAFLPLKTHPEFMLYKCRLSVRQNLFIFCHSKYWPLLFVWQYGTQPYACSFFLILKKMAQAFACLYQTFALQYLSLSRFWNEKISHIFAPSNRWGLEKSNSQNDVPGMHFWDL